MNYPANIDPKDSAAPWNQTTAPEQYSTTMDPNELSGVRMAGVDPLDAPKYTDAYMEVAFWGEYQLTPDECCEVCIMNPEWTRIQAEQSLID